MNILKMLNNAAPETTSLVFRTWANSATCALIGTVANIITRERKYADQGGIDAFENARDEAKGDNLNHDLAGVDEKISLNQLVELTAALRAQAQTLADGFPMPERRFASPQDVAGSYDFLATPKTEVDSEQIAAAKEEDPDMTDAEAITEIQETAMEDAARLHDVRDIAVARINDLLGNAPADREIDAILAGLPETYRYGMIDKACASVVKELKRTRKLAIRGVPGISAKRSILKADLPAMEAMAA